MEIINPGKVALLGSGETASVGGIVFDRLSQDINAPVHIGVLETPAGFELNSSYVAGKIADFLKVRLQNHSPIVEVIPARKKGTDFSPENPKIVSQIYGKDIIFLGPGSPTYAVRQLKNSKAWEAIRCLHASGGSIVLASAASFASGCFAVPVYEIFKAGSDPYWVNGLDLFGVYNLSLVVWPHWNNTDGGKELDTSHCFLGKTRAEELFHLLKTNVTILGIDEHTAVILDFRSGTAEVFGGGAVHIIRETIETNYFSGKAFSLDELGKFQIPTLDCFSQFDMEQIRNTRNNRIIPSERIPNKKVLDLMVKRRRARESHNWEESDCIRKMIYQQGWRIEDTVDGQRLINLL